MKHTNRFPKLDPSIKEIWITALRHKHYQACQRRLRIGSRFCAVAVLINELAPDRWEDYSDTEPDTYCIVDHQRDMYSSMRLTPDLREQFGLDLAAERIVARLNDSGVGFGVIAKWVKRNRN
jgi:hypothetical protein